MARPSWITKEAVDLYRALAAEDPAYEPELVGALVGLEQRYADARRDPARFATVLDTTLDSLTGPARAQLCWRRAATADPGDVGAVDWLTTALEDSGDDRVLTAALHEQARRHREPDPTRFDTQWTHATRRDAPDWLVADPVLLAAARGWVNTDTYETEQGWLAAHPELLDPGADTAVTEALLPLPDEEAGRYRAVRATARTGGVEEAYRLLQLLAHEFAQADTARQRAVLTDRGPDLRTDTVEQVLDALSEDDC